MAKGEHRERRHLRGMRSALEILNGRGCEKATNRRGVWRYLSGRLMTLSTRRVNKRQQIYMAA